MLSFLNPNSFGKEGVDHINISKMSTTQLGLLLDPSYFKVIDYPHLGKFASVLNLWYWLKSDPLDDSFRRTTGFRLKGKIQQVDTRNKVPNFKAIIGEATYIKLKQYPDGIKYLKSLRREVQFISYYIPKGTSIRMCSSYAMLMGEIVEVIRKDLREGREPDFTCLASHPEAIESHFLQLFLHKNLSASNSV